MAKVSIVIPVWDMQNTELAIQLLERNLNSILGQTFKGYEVIVSDDSVSDEIYKWLSFYTANTGLQLNYCKNPGDKGMANNTNYGIDQATGDLIKILFQDDYFFNELALQDIVRHFTPTYNWLVTGCTHFNGEQYFNDHLPYYSYSENTIGSPSVITFRREVAERFDPNFDWVLDLDLYRRLVKNYGKPKILNSINIIIGIGSHQTTNKLSDEQKYLEHQLLNNKNYA